MRSKAYIGTISRDEMDKVEELREEVYSMFDGVDVKVRGRLGYNNPNRWRYGRSGTRRHQMILNEDAASYDIYVYRRDWMTPQGRLNTARDWARGVWEILNKPSRDWLWD